MLAKSSSRELVVIAALAMMEIVYVSGAESNEVDIENGLDDFDEKLSPKRYQVAIFNFKQVSHAYTITLWIILGALAKIGLNLILFKLCF